MLKSYLKTALRSLVRHKAFSLINILGFAFSISICMMIILFIIKEYSYDRYHANADCIYKLIDSENNSSGIDYRLKKTLVDNFPEIRSGCITQTLYGETEINYRDKKYFVDNIMSADDDYFKIFMIPFLSGSVSTPFLNQNSAVITNSSAGKIFGHENPIGKEIFYDNVPLTVTGVISDFPDNSSLNANIIVNAENNVFKFKRSFAVNKPDSYPFNIYLLFKKDANIKRTINSINKYQELLNPYINKLNLLPLKDIYLYDSTVGSDNKKGNPALLNILTSIALIIFILAVVNYINLTISQQSRRNKETGIRKTIGAGRKDIILFYLAESTLIAFAAFIIALLIVELSLPYFSRIIEHNLSIKPLEEFPGNFILIIAVFSTGIISGLGPALFLSSFNPIKIISGNIAISNKKSYLRNILTVFQFTVSIALIFCLIVVQKQINYVKHSDLGFNKEQLLRLDLNREEFSKAPVLINELKRYSNIKDVSGSGVAPDDIGMKITGFMQGKPRLIQFIGADASFLQTFKIKLLMGRELLPGDYGKVCIINATAYNYFGWKDLKDKKFKWGGYNVIGVVKDFHIYSFHDAIEPVCITFSSNYSTNVISVRIKPGAVPETIDYIKKTWAKLIPDYPIKYQFYDDVFNEMYLKEERLAEIIGLFATLAISISCMGILGLVIFASERRSKEIGIRKVHGAKVSELMFMLNKDFLKWVILASVIALPLGWYVINKWLQDFAYKTDISWWVYLLAGLAALTIAFLTVSWQTWRTVRRNPVEVLRYE